jgi:hypothetical protein
VDNTGWLDKNCTQVHINRSVVAPGVEHELVHSVRVVLGRLFVHNVMYHMYIIPHPEAVQTRFSLRAAKKTENGLI